MVLGFTFLGVNAIVATTNGDQITKKYHQKFAPLVNLPIGINQEINRK